MNHYIYIDDIRDDDEWYNAHLNRAEWRPHLCRNYERIVHLITLIMHRHRNVSFILDLDYDLGEGNENELEPTGYDICKWVIENHIPLTGFHIHSMNGVGAQNMRQLLTHYGYQEI